MIINGRAIAKKILIQIKEESAQFKKRPSFATILIGDNEASKIYIKRKKKIAVQLNFGFKNYYFKHTPKSPLKRGLSVKPPFKKGFSVNPPFKKGTFCQFSPLKRGKGCVECLILEKQILKLIDKLNQDTNVCGILIQFPLPAILDADQLVESLYPYKDIDGFHPQNIQKFLKIKNYLKIDLIDKNKQRDFLLPVTPTAIIEIIKDSGVKLKKQKVVVVGKKSVFLTPLIHFFKLQGLGLTQVYPLNMVETPYRASLEKFYQEVKSADILITALGQAQFIKKEMIKPGVFIIDVGINRKDGKVVGDVDFDDVASLCSYITPVSGGVGPVTLAVLMANVCKAYRLMNG